MEAIWESIQTLKVIGEVKTRMDNIVKLLEKETNLNTDGLTESGSAPLNLRTDPNSVPVIEFSKVSVIGEDKDKVCFLRNVTFSISRGEIVALVGGSGAGKSTISNLLLRKILPSTGLVKILGNVLEDFGDIRNLYREVVIVPQRPIIFNESVEYNLTYGSIRNLDAHKQLLENSGVQAMINQHKENKVSKKILSGGECQRIAIVRTMLKTTIPKIIILDEVTNALDSQSQKVVMKLVFKYVKRNHITCIIIAHRLSTISKADKIIVLQKLGEKSESSVVEVGTHKELLQIKGYYSKLVEMEK